MAFKIAFAVCFGISATLILRLWIVQRRDSFFKRLFWSMVLLFPVVGWVFYGGCYRPLSKNTVYAPLNRDAFYSGHGS